MHENPATSIEEMKGRAVTHFVNLFKCDHRAQPIPDLNIHFSKTINTKLNA